MRDILLSLSTRTSTVASGAENQSCMSFLQGNGPGQSQSLAVASPSLKDKEIRFSRVISLANEDPYSHRRRRFSPIYSLIILAEASNNSSFLNSLGDIYI